MNTLESVCIGDYYEPQPKQQEFHDSDARGNIVDRCVNGEQIVEIVFPAHAYIGECLGVCSVL
jgi:hypothetical protein